MLGVLHGVGDTKASMTLSLTLRLSAVSENLHLYVSTY